MKAPDINSVSFQRTKKIVYALLIVVITLAITRQEKKIPTDKYIGTTKTN